jgi:hypothetical protein
MNGRPRVYAMLTHELARGAGSQPAGFYPKAYVVVDDERTQTWYPLYPQGDPKAVPRDEADRIMYPLVKKWLQRKGWEDAAVYVKRAQDTPEGA